jgi:hypothetical protein
MKRHILTLVTVFLTFSIGAVPSYAVSQKEHAELKKNITFLKKVLYHSTKLNHTHEHSKDISLLTTPVKRNYSNVEYKHGHHWKSSLDFAEKALIKAFNYHTKNMHNSQTSTLDRRMERKTLFLVKRSLAFSEKTLHIFRNSLLSSKSRIKPKLLENTRADSFHVLADAAYHNIQQIRKITSSPRFEQK